MATYKKKFGTATAKAKCTDRKFVDFTESIGLEFEVPENSGIWISNGTYSPRFNVNMDDDGKEVLSGFTRHIKIEGCAIEVIENERGYAEMLIKPKMS